MNLGLGHATFYDNGKLCDPNSSQAPIEAEATDIRETSIRQGATDIELAHVDLSHIRTTYSHPHMTGHRVSLAGGLYKGCQHESDKITFHFSQQLLDVDSFGPSPSFTVQARDGSAPIRVSCAVLLAADGVKSVTRVAMLRQLNVTAKIIDTVSFVPDLRWSSALPSTMRLKLSATLGEEWWNKVIMHE